MKKLILIAALMLSVVSFASETEKNENKNLLTNPLNYEDLKEKNPDNLFVICNTHNWYVTVRRQVLSMYTNQTCTEETTYLVQSCTTCFYMGVSGVTSTTECLY